MQMDMVLQDWHISRISCGNTSREKAFDQVIPGLNRS